MDRFINTNQAIDQGTLPGSQVYQLLKQDDLFHRSLAERATEKNRVWQVRVWQVIDELKTQMNRVRFLSFTHFHVAQMIEQHTTVVDTIETGSSTDAVNHIRKHLREILKSLPVISREKPDFFDSANDEIVGFSTIALPENFSGERNVS